MIVCSIEMNLSSKNRKKKKKKTILNASLWCFFTQNPLQISNCARSIESPFIMRRHASLCFLRNFIHRFIFLMCIWFYFFSSSSFSIILDRQIIIMRRVFVTYLKWIALHWLQLHRFNKTTVRIQSKKKKNRIL